MLDRTAAHEALRRLFRSRPVVSLHGLFAVHPTNAYFDSWMPRILSLKNSMSRKP